MMLFRRFAVSWMVAVMWVVIGLGFGWFSLLLLHWPVSLTMVFGSFIAGATAEGGGAVAFPVFTKLLHVPPVQARDFALAIQSVGMTCGALLIIRSGYPFFASALFWTFPSAAVTVILGISYLAPLVPPMVSRLFFTLLTTCFGVFLWLNLRMKEEPGQALRVDSWKRRAGFCLTGAVGGLIASLVGSGADVALFVVLCLRYRVDEKMGTRTTVILMAGVSMVGFACRCLTGQIHPEVFHMWFCATPIVAFGAPLGALFCSGQKREHVVGFLLGLIGIELVTTLWLLPLGGSEVLWGGAFVLICLTVMGGLRGGSGEARVS